MYTHLGIALNWLLWDTSCSGCSWKYFLFNNWHWIHRRMVFCTEDCIL